MSRRSLDRSTPKEGKHKVRRVRRTNVISGYWICGGDDRAREIIRRIVLRKEKDWKEVEENKGCVEDNIRVDRVR